MDHEVRCPACSAPNRTAPGRLDERAVCTRCRAELGGTTAPDKAPSTDPLGAERHAPAEDVRAQVATAWGNSLMPSMTAAMTIRGPQSRPAPGPNVVVKAHTVTRSGERPSVPPDYELLDVLGEGGMGVVYAARQTSVDRTIAVKMIRSEAADNEDARARFLSEAAVTGDLEHPNIMPIYDLGADDTGALFYAMKRVQGTRWSQAIGAKPLGEDLQVLLRVADACAFAHSRGVIHRDLKPDNIMVGDFGEVLVMDWGLAKVLSQGADGRGQKSEAEEREKEGSADRPEGGRAPNPEQNAQSDVTPDLAVRSQVSSVRSESDLALTAEGQVTGTPFYMSPEQAEGDTDRLDHRSDIYSLGAILYEILTLERPVEGRTMYEVLLNVSDGRIVPPQERSPHRAVPAEPAAIAMKALSTRPEDRYQSVPEMSDDIRLYFEGRAVSAKEDSLFEAVTKLVKRNREIFATGSIAALLLLALAGYSFSRVVKERNGAIDAGREATQARSIA